MKRALLASYEKDDHLLALAGLLTKHGWSLLGSAGTAKFLSSNGYACRDIAEIVGPPILGHRVVSLARQIYAALLSTPKDEEELLRLGIRPVGLVYVTLYPLEKTIADKKSTPENVLEKTDIGGPTLLRAAAKGRRLALSSPDQIAELRACLETSNRADDKERLVLKFAAAAERRVAEYVAASADYWESRLEYPQGGKKRAR